MASDKHPSVLRLPGSLAMADGSPTMHTDQSQSVMHAEPAHRLRGASACVHQANARAHEQKDPDKENKSPEETAYEDRAVSQGADESRDSHPRGGRGSRS